MLPFFRQHGEYNSGEKACFHDLLQQALRDRLAIKLVVSIRTSLITDGPINDILFNAVPFTFKPNQKNSGNPMNDRMPMKLMLEGKVNWLTKDRSDSEQRLSAKILIDWAEPYCRI